MFSHQPINTTSMEKEESTPLNMIDMLDSLKESCPGLAEITIQERLDELEKIRDANRPKGRPIRGGADDLPYFFYECGDRIVRHPKEASKVSDRWRYRRVPNAASGVRPSPLVRAPRYVGNALVPNVRQSRSKTAHMGAENGRILPPAGMHPYNRIDKRVGTARTHNGKGGKPPAHLAGVPAELLAHDPTAPPPTVRIMLPPTRSGKPSTPDAPKRAKRGILKSSSHSPKSGHKSKPPSQEDVEAARRHEQKKKRAAEKIKVQKRVTFWLNSTSPPKYDPPVLPAPVMHSYIASQQANELTAGLAGLSIATAHS